MSKNKQMERSINKVTSKVPTISENNQKKINDYYFRTTESLRKNVELVPKSSHDLFQNIKNEKETDDGDKGEKEADSNRVNKMVTKSNTNSTTKLEEQAGASGKSKVTKKCLIFEKLIKENISQETVQRVTKATNEVKKGLGQDPEDQDQLLYEGKCSHHTEVPETQHQHAGHVPSSHQEDQVLE